MFSGKAKLQVRKQVYKQTPATQVYKPTNKSAGKPATSQILKTAWSHDIRPFNRMTSQLIVAVTPRDGQGAGSGVDFIGYFCPSRKLFRAMRVILRCCRVLRDPLRRRIFSMRLEAGKPAVYVVYDRLYDIFGRVRRCRNYVNIFKRMPGREKRISPVDEGFHLTRRFVAINGGQPGR